MKCVVLAYHNIGRAGIEALRKNGFEISAVFTHQDNPDENIWFGSVAELAGEYDIPVFAPESVNHPVWVNRIRAMKPDYIFSFYYRDMLGGEILSIPSKGAINLHGSLLPKYRGRVPLNWAIINGETEAGVTLHYMTKKADAGDIISQEKFAITDDDTAKTVFDKAAEAAKVLLDRELPKIAAGTASRTPQDESKATTFGGRKPADGEIDWTKSAKEVRNLIRAVTKPYPGAFSYIGDRKCFFWSADVADQDRKAAPGTVLSAAPFTIACGEGALRIRTAQLETGVFMTGDQLAAEARIVPNMVFGANPKKLREQGRKKSVLILGVNGFIGSHLSERLLDSGKYEVYGLDLRSNYIDHLLGREGFHFREGDISIHREWIEYHIRKCDIILPLVAIATPIEYTRNPLRVFELDFEENLRIVRYCVKYNKRIIFPSTSEVYGMCQDPQFDEDNSKLVTGPIRMQRWIYSTSKPAARPRDLGLRSEGAAAVHAVPSVQLDRTPARQPDQRPHRFVPRDHAADPESRAGVSDSAHRRRRTEALLRGHLRRNRSAFPDHREQGQQVRRRDHQHRQSRERGEHQGDGRNARREVRQASAAFEVPAVCGLSRG